MKNAIARTINTGISKERKDMKKTLNIEGMSCMHCVNAVTKALNAVEGVEKTDVDLEAKTAIVELSGAVADETLNAAIVEAGFSVV